MEFMGYSIKKSREKNITENTIDIKCMQEEDFCIMMLEQILYKIIDDALVPIEIQGEENQSLIRVGQLFLTDEQNNMQEDMIFKASRSLREITLRSLYRNFIIYKIQIAGDFYYFTDYINGIRFNKNSLNINNIEYPVIKAYSITRNHIYNIEGLLYPFRALYSIYKSILLNSQKSNMIFFKKKNFNNVVDGMSPENYKKFLQTAQETLRLFIDGNGGIIDAEDSFEIPSVDLSGAVSILDFAYKEIARVFDIPMTELIGESPTGLSSAGVVQFQDITYGKRLKHFRKTFIYPFLKDMDIAYMESGMTPQEIMDILAQVSTYGTTLEAIDKDLFYIYKKNTLDMCGIDENKLLEIRKEMESIEPQEELTDNTSIISGIEDALQEHTKEIN